MKAKVLMLSLAVALSSFAANAQQEAESNLSAYRTEFEQDLSAHWFIELHGGAAMLPFGAPANAKAEFMKRVSPIVSLSVGRWAQPYFGTRARLYAWNVYGFDQKNGAQDVTRYKNFFGAASFEFMFDVVNYFAPYRESRVFHLVPFVGVGYHHKFFSQEDVDGAEQFGKHDMSGMLNGGLALKFRLGKRVDLNLEGQMMLSKNNFVGTRTNLNEADMTAMASAGLTFKLGKVEFVPVTPLDYALINDLNSQISGLRAENAELSKRPVSCPECPDFIAPASTAKQQVENVVYFRISSAKIDKNQMINIYNTAQYAKNNGGKIYIVGYADEKTGTPEINMAISQRRAEAVQQALIDKYGVNPSDIVIDYKGDTVQPYATNEWNRIVIMTIEK